MVGEKSKQKHLKVNCVKKKNQNNNNINIKKIILFMNKFKI